MLNSVNDKIQSSYTTPLPQNQTLLPLPPLLLPSVRLGYQPSVSPVYSDILHYLYVFLLVFPVKRFLIIDEADVQVVLLYTYAPFT